MIFPQEGTKVNECAEAVKTCFDAILKNGTPAPPSVLNQRGYCLSSYPSSPAALSHGSGFVLWPMTSVTLMGCQFSKVSQ
jgi:hypothetical protein